MTIREIDVNSLITRTRVPAADYVINPYGGCPHKCVYCYAEFMRRFSHHEEAWGEYLDVKRCARRINAKKYAGRSVVLSTVTDAYNPFEKKYGVTREILEKFAGAGARITVLTKSDLVTRDIDVLRRLPGSLVGISMSTVDDSVRAKIEPRAASVERRVEALRALRRAGVPCYVFVSPILPGITDFRAIVEACAPYTDTFHFENLNLRGAFRPRVLAFVAAHDPGLLPLYDTIYARGDVSYWEAKEREIIGYCEKRGLRCVSYFYHERIVKR